ncbi:unnamed protein product (macronuclear) [Paramecium tetraurelia]|uniref:Uncharacterized protein n=1 Tax=Paramecium tetraurelia TaxID=5888 RepID=A0CGZ2_PARTE|nr:uncharacterized protein GSPATT00007499001 [Paramecium tetraurelia]CAK70059.1 unnamed protein product [Paramecium tetraurelia]|eukprot:XP_001437456.1 hypothetical protein (macronuclear) [Paramecium tetraurelia strain d4-2]
MKRQKQFELKINEKIQQPYTPLRMSPSFRIKFQSPTKVQKIKYIYQKDLKEYESHYFDQFADTYRIPTIHTQRAASLKQTQMQLRQQTPNYMQLNPKDSEQESDKLSEFLRIIRGKKQVRIIEHQQ